MMTYIKSRLVISSLLVSMLRVGKWRWLHQLCWWSCALLYLATPPLTTRVPLLYHTQRLTMAPVAPPPLASPPITTPSHVSISRQHSASSSKSVTDLLIGAASAASSSSVLLPDGPVEPVKAEGLRHVRIRLVARCVSSRLPSHAEASFDGTSRHPPSA
mgnify:CR=1 FL=1